MYGFIRRLIRVQRSFDVMERIGLLLIGPVRREPARSHKKTSEHLRFGEEATRIDEDIESTISACLHQQNSSDRILVVFDSRTEMKWASQTCPSLLDQFAAYVDVQQLMANVSDNQHPSLRKSLFALGINEGVPASKDRQYKTPHRAANDVVYTLAILASLMSLPPDAAPMSIPKKSKRLVLFYGRPRPKERYPFTALLRTLDCTPLPPALDTSGKVYNYFSSFNPITAGTGIARNPHTRPDSFRKAQLSRSWICFGSKLDLDAFLLAVNHTTVGGGKSIIVESYYHPGVSLTVQERFAKQIEDTERIREERSRMRSISRQTLLDLDDETLDVFQLFD
ncbi:hypothetical protein FKW77_009971 [Venturia effusa]|uniref:Uncharacterized protein n=1 Tax=Venturia effusa TaxID=50376 RepID=A0A517L687_9PEZI|nr:hypothetical protein FKW77_009971 [Venturia effusa]